MARKESTFTASSGRDAGKQYFIREMPASQAERWAIRVILAAGNAGIEIPPDLAAQGMQGLLAVGYMNLLKIPFESAGPLLDEMMACVQRVESSITRPLLENDIEEVATRFQLRKAIFVLHTDFFTEGGPQTSASAQPGNNGETPLNIKPRRQRSAP